MPLPPFHNWCSYLERVLLCWYSEGDRRWGDYSARKLGELAGTDIRIEEGVLLDECSALLREYDFQQGRS